MAFSMIPSVRLKPIFFVFAFFLVQNFFSQKLPLLQLSKDRSYIETADGSPFFWLGDTAWELVHRLDREEIIKYLENRQKKGFTLIQTVIIAEMNGVHEPNAYGDLPLVEEDLGQLNQRYFEHVDFVISEAGKRGLYVGLLPAWGDKIVKKWSMGPEIFTPVNAVKYGKLLGKRYRNHSNIIWILGGDRIPETKEHEEIVRSMARGLKKEDTKHLISYHPSGGEIASDYFDENWLDIDMFQSGHSSLIEEYKYPQKIRNRKFSRPLINGEARYEDIPDRFWQEEDYGRLDDRDVRVSAYWSLLAGATGYTYGSNDIWQMFSPGENHPSLNARLGWKKALDQPGAEQMKYLKKLFSSFNWHKMKPAQELILSLNPEDAGYIVAAKATDFAIFYTPQGRAFQVDFQQLAFEKPNAYWYNPRTGTSEKIINTNSSQKVIFEAPSSGRGYDWVLILLPAHNNLKLSKQP